MVRLTADLILRSPQYFNAVREREIDLRGNKIAAVENLGATEVCRSVPSDFDLSPDWVLERSHP
jgi:hypothetical protein